MSSKKEDPKPFNELNWFKVKCNSCENYVVVKKDERLKFFPNLDMEDFKMLYTYLCCGVKSNDEIRKCALVFNKIDINQLPFDELLKAFNL